MKMNFRRRFVSAVGFVFIAGGCLLSTNVLQACPVQDEDKTAKESVQETEESLSDHLASLQEKMQKAQMEFYDKLDEFGDDEEAIMKFVDENAPDFSEELSGLMEMVRKNPDDASAPSALGMIANGFGSDVAEDAKRMLFENYMGSPESLQALQGLAYDPSAANEAMLKNIISNNEDPKTVASVKFAYAEYLLGLTEMRGYLEDEESRSFFDEDAIEYLQSERAVTPEAQAEELLTSLLEDKEVDKGTMARVKKQLFAIQNLGIGKTAPEILGEDTDGVAFKLSDYRGKVVMLDFWGDW